MAGLEIDLRLDTLELTNSEAIAGVVYFSVAGVDFPDGNWYDFPVVVLTWWIDALRKRVDGAPVGFEFMEGPYALQVQENAEALHVQGLRNGSPVLSMTTGGDCESLQMTILKAATALARACQERGWMTDDVDALRHGIALSQAQT